MTAKNNIIPFAKTTTPQFPKPTFKGVIPFEECPVVLDFADLLVHVFRQLPERSQDELMKHLEKIGELVEHVGSNGDEKSRKLLESLGYFV